MIRPFPLRLHWPRVSKLGLLIAGLALMSAILVPVAHLVFNTGTEVTSVKKKLVEEAKNDGEFFSRAQARFDETTYATAAKKFSDFTSAYDAYKASKMYLGAIKKRTQAGYDLSEEKQRAQKAAVENFSLAVNSAVTPEEKIEAFLILRNEKGLAQAQKRFPGINPPRPHVTPDGHNIGFELRQVARKLAEQR